MSDRDELLSWERLARSLAPEILALIEQAVRIAETQHMPIYLVGGPVRDLFLQQSITDIDLVVEGDAWTIAEAFQAEAGGKLTRHAAFRTAAVEIMIGAEPFVIDFVTARREVYPAPAALPVIMPSHIHDDLRRRDFTINTLALRLTAADVTLLDPFAGVEDIRAGLVRVLHDESFVDDPTRMLRGVRFASRFAFAVVPHTTALVGAALAENMIGRTSPQRILHELWLLLAEPRPEGALLLLYEWGAFPQLELVWSSAWLRQFPAARAAASPDLPLHLIGFGLLVWPMSQAQRSAFATRYNLPTAERKLLHELPFAVPPALHQPELSALELERLLHAYSPMALCVLQLVASEVAAAQIALYATTIRQLPALLSGDDLRERGVPPGPIYREILHELRQAQLAGTIMSRAEALIWLERRLAQA
ncbi:MAG TPA: hypothetical protein VGD69_17805 [Herpetosiphonaceae bacterium]